MDNCVVQKRKPSLLRADFQWIRKNRLTDAIVYRLAINQMCKPRATDRKPDDLTSINQQHREEMHRNAPHAALFFEPNCCYAPDSERLISDKEHRTKPDS